MPQRSVRRASRRINLFRIHDRSKNHVSAFSRTVQKSELWVTEIRKELTELRTDDAYHLLGAVLHTLRDQLSVHECAQFAAQLPLLLRGTFYECWNPPSQPPRTRSKDEFTQAVKDKTKTICDSHPDFDLEDGVKVVLKVIAQHVSVGEFADILATLQPSLKLFFEDAVGEIRRT